jgi:SAM-dependent methyltransferase
MNKGKDPIGKAILEYAKTKKVADILVHSEICEDDIIPVEVLFRTYEEMPELEKIALENCDGNVLDVGAGAGIHSAYLAAEGCNVEAIDFSYGAVEYMKSIGINATNLNFFDLKDKKYDTILLLMNGIGIAGSLANLEKTLIHAKSLLNPGGKIICDSSDIRYLYQEEDGSLWIDLNSDYYGNFRVQNELQKGDMSDWFDWLYVDFDTLFKSAKKVGMKAVRLYEKDNNYLAKISF